MSLGLLVTRPNPVPMPTVTAPPAPTGTRDVQITAAGQSIGDPATLRNLTLNGTFPNVAVPAGTYGAFSANGSCGFIFGVAGATQPAVYNLTSLTLNSSTVLQVVGPVILNLGSSLTLNGNAGASTNPTWLTVRVASGNVTLNGSVSLYGVVQCPNGTVTINNLSQLVGSVACSTLTINGSGLLKGAGGAVPYLTPASPAPGQLLSTALHRLNTE